MNIKIIQPASMGDVIIILPIAKFLQNKGYNVIYPIYSSYGNWQPYIDYVKFVPVNDIQSAINYPCEKSLNLLIGFKESPKEHDAEWLSSPYSFDQWKYEKAGVPIEEKYNFTFTRNIDKENALKKHLTVSQRLDFARPYTVEHQRGSKVFRDFRSSSNRVVIEPINGYTIFDWYGILESADKIFCVDSCFANFVNQLHLCVGKRYFYPCYDGYGTRGKMYHHVPLLKSDWEILEK